MTRIALQDWVEDEIDNFAVVPDANWYMIRPLYLHTLDRLANKYTLAHIKEYNMEAGVYYSSLASLTFGVTRHEIDYELSQTRICDQYPFKCVEKKLFCLGIKSFVSCK